MPNSNSVVTSNNKNQVRPVLLVDADTADSYAAFLRHLIAGLAADSCPTALVCPSKVNADSIICPSVEVIRHPLFKIPLLQAQNTKTVFDALTKFRPTVLHCCSDSKARITKQLSNMLDIPYILTYNSVKRQLFAPLISTDHCAALIASSTVINEHLMRTHPRLADRIKQINIGVFVEDTCACFSDAGRVTSMVVALTNDNLLDMESLLNAVKHLAVDGYEFMLIITGTGRAERKLHKLIRTLGLSQIVITVGNVQPLRAVFAGADIFIMPQPGVRFDQQLLEAMSVGMAVAACRGGVDDLLIEGETALIFEPDDELSIYSTLQKLLDRREFAMRIAMAAQNHLREHYGVSKMVASITKTYRAAQEWYKKSGNSK
ncbi:MAG: glycosyltransferase family 4 protein [Planctomycetota bacterium]|jgi:glycosyltransferase involved in cell wall biosynthesis